MNAGTGRQQEREGNWRLRPLETAEDARKVAEFLLSGDSFDDERPTPGELDDFRSKPYAAARQERQQCWMATEESGRVLGALLYEENEHRTGGYIMDYLAVHRSFRKAGIASALLGRMIESVRARGGRFIETFTCDLPVYEPVRQLFKKKGFTSVGHLPDYYYEGEGKLLYWLPLHQGKDAVDRERAPIIHHTGIQQ